MTLSEQFIHAMWSHDEEKVSELLDRMDSDTVNEKYATEDEYEEVYYTYSEETPLLAACIANKIEIVARLLTIPGIDVNLSDERGNTPLHYACENNYFQIVDLLLATPGIKVNCKAVFGLTPLNLACKNNHVEVIAKLRAFPGIDVNSRDEQNLGPSPVMEAAMKGNREPLSMLLQDLRTDLNIKMKDGKGLEELVPMDRVDCLEMIMDARSERDMTQVRGLRNQESGDRQAGISLLRKLIAAMKSKDDRSEMIRWGHIVLHVACIYGYVVPLNGLLAIPDIDVNNADVAGRTALHHAASKNQLQIIDMLLAAPSINVNVKDKDGQTPLHYASSKNHVEVVDKLLNVANINVNCVDDLDERTPLHYACYHNHPQVVARLLAFTDINVNSKDDAGQTPLHLACSTNHLDVVIRRLAKAKNMDANLLRARLLSKINNMIVNNNNMVVNSVNQLLSDVINVDEDELTTLFDACSENHSQIVCNLLAAQGINVNARNEARQTPLQLLCSQRASQLMVLKMLLKDSRVDLDVKDSDGNGLEELVSTKGNECLKMLKEARRERENVRKEFIGKIDKMNHSIETEELRLRNCAQAKEKEMQLLNEKKDLEKTKLETNLTLKTIQLKQKRAELEKQLENVDKELIETEQRKANQTTLIDNKYKEDMFKLNDKYKDDEGTEKLDDMKKIRNKLTTDLNKFENKIKR